MTPPEPYYIALGDGRFESTVQAQGAWNPHEQHMAPVSGILTHCLEGFSPRPDLRMARLSFEILGLIPDGEFEVVTSMLRPGRTIELVQAELIAGGRVAVRASAWRMQRSDTSAVAAVEDPPMPARDRIAAPASLTTWPGGYIRSIDVFPTVDHRAGSGSAWLRTRHPLVSGARDSDTPYSEFAALIGLVDTSNGIAVRVPPGGDGYAFPNLDLQLHLYRQPAGRWLGLQNSVTFGSDGIGLTSSVLHDEVGPFGRAEQILTLRKL
ncbi:thioesterase family protein [Rathayibacter soli]|uniref:thioesterase family protein n=1 Tax=Rathayibacter soli TaxID=3144168 RepID=UPI0027E4F6BF|nr:thioesterase family protein [Glaciibacter superstes]